MCAGVFDVCMWCGVCVRCLWLCVCGVCVVCVWSVCIWRVCVYGVGVVCACECGFGVCM